MIGYGVTARYKGEHIQILIRTNADQQKDTQKDEKSKICKRVIMVIKWKNDTMADKDERHYGR